MHAALEEGFRHLAVIDRRHHDAHGVHATEQVACVGIRVAAVLPGYLLRRLLIDIGHAHEIDIRHGGIDARMNAAEVADARHADAQFRAISFRVRVGCGSHGLIGRRSPSARPETKRSNSMSAARIIPEIGAGATNDAFHCLSRHAPDSTNTRYSVASILAALASAARISSAFSTGTPCLYGRSPAVSASYMSAIVMIRDWTGILSAERRRG